MMMTTIGTMDHAQGETIAVEISDTQAHLRVDRQAVAALVRHVLAAEGVRRGSISLAVVDDATIHAVNRAHLDHDWPTDVISFTLSGPDEDEMAGELVVSAETAAREAEARGLSAADELNLYVAHGLLHLCGFEDGTEAEAQAMRRREAEVLGLVFAAETEPEPREDGPWSA
jgi:probable rRNA maturation factor